MIEVSTYSPPGVHSVQNEHLVSSGRANDFFKKIGHFTLEDNSATSFKARELKTVYINQNCQYLKLSCSKSYANNKNIFNQVAIVGLKCNGQPLGIYESSMLQGQGPGVIKTEPTADLPSQYIPRNLKMVSMEHKEFDSVILEKIEKLEKEKGEALAQEDFDQCKQIKQVIDRLKIVGNQLISMNQEKEMAIKNEDYEVAK